MRRSSGKSGQTPVSRLTETFPCCHPGIPGDGWQQLSLILNNVTGVAGASPSPRGLEQGEALTLAWALASRLMQSKFFLPHRGRVSWLVERSIGYSSNSRRTTSGTVRGLSNQHFNGAHVNRCQISAYFQLILRSEGTPCVVWGTSWHSCGGSSHIPVEK